MNNNIESIRTNTAQINDRPAYNCDCFGQFLRNKIISKGKSIEQVITSVSWWHFKADT